MMGRGLSVMHRDTDGPGGCIIGEFGRQARANGPFDGDRADDDEAASSGMGPGSATSGDDIGFAE